MAASSFQNRMQSAAQPRPAYSTQMQAHVTPNGIPVPVSGWNTRDAVTGMSPTDAVQLDNWYPDAGGLTLRNGFIQHTSGLGTGYVRTVATFWSESQQQLIAMCGGNIYNASGAPVVLQSGMDSDIWQTANFQSRLFMANGKNHIQVYDGTTCKPATFNAGDGTREVTSLCVYMNRIYAVLENSSSFWYADLNAVQGPLHEFPLAGVSQLGGALEVITTFSHDGGSGVQDFICFIMSSGEVIMYFGIDPSDPLNWNLMGKYRLAPPVNNRAVAQYGGDTYLTTADDHVPLQQQLVAIKVGAVPPRSKISGAVGQAVANVGNAFGWQIIYYPKGRRVICNIPTVTGTFEQHVYNTSQDAWCRFQGMDAACWTVWNNSLYFGSNNGIVYQADFGNLDIDQPITATGQPAWNDFGDPRRKRVSAIRPVVTTYAGVNVNYGIGFDYNTITRNNTVTTTVPGPQSLWDVNKWDVTPWSSESDIYDKWKLAGGTGTSVGMNLQVTASTPFSWLRNDVRYEPGRDL